MMAYFAIALVILAVPVGIAYFVAWAIEAWEAEVRKPWR